MQFKTPEILYFLTLLIIPLLVHLFQLQKYVKVPFTNVAFLEKILQQNRKSSRIKKWLLLVTRLLLLTAIIFAFSQPYFSNKKADLKQHHFIYLDNSLSTNTMGERGNLLQIAAQDIIEYTSEKEIYSLQTNSNFYEKISKDELRKILLRIKETSKKIDISTVLLKFKTKKNNTTKDLDRLTLISDFQNFDIKKFTNVTSSFSAVKLKSSIKSNISIDSVFISNINTTNFTLNVLIRNQGVAKNDIPIAIYNNSKLINKLSTSFEKDSYKTVQFKVKNQREFRGKIETSFSDVFTFDNVFYFTLKNDQKINVLSIGNKTDFLSKIYTKKGFNFSQKTVRNTNYNSILKQQLIILNELENIPEILIKKIKEYSEKGGDLVIIPNENSNISSYNYLLRKLKVGKIFTKKVDTLKITTINYEHPLFQNVFSKKITNFQYPNTKSHFPISSKNLSNIISFENNTPFISQIKNGNHNIYWFSSSLNIKNSNFINSALIVPVFFNFGSLSFKQSQLFYRINTKNKIDIETSLKKEKILKITNSASTFIPLQLRFQNKVQITTEDTPLNPGFYDVLKDNEIIQKLAFNYPKDEGNLNFMDLSDLREINKNGVVSTSISDVFKVINKKNEVHWLWKWFLTLAIVSLFLEILILKFYKP
jgi:hypothetical protein